MHIFVVVPRRAYGGDFDVYAHLDGPFGSLSELWFECYGRRSLEKMLLRLHKRWRQHTGQLHKYSAYHEG